MTVHVNLMKGNASYLSMRPHWLQAIRVANHTGEGRHKTGHCKAVGM